MNKNDRPAFSAEEIVLDYAISAVEGDSAVTILLQFKDQHFGDALKIPPPGKVELDGQVIPADSAKIGGYFYEIRKPLAGFNGTHEILYTDNAQNSYREKFLFEPLVLLHNLPDTLDGTAFELKFSGIQSRDQLSIIMRDTALFHDDQRKVAEPGISDIIITSPDMGALFDGPVQVEFVKEAQYNLQQTPGGGGQLKTSYAIKKELFLRRGK